MNTYSEAVEKRWRFVASMRQLPSLVREDNLPGAGEVGSLALRLRQDCSSAEVRRLARVFGDLGECMLGAESFYVSKQIGLAVISAASSIPLETMTLSAGMLPAESGFVWFDHPIELETIHDKVIGYQEPYQLPVAIHAIAWASANASGTHAMIASIASSHGVDSLGLIDFCVVAMDRPIAEQNISTVPERDKLVRWWASFLLWIDQRIVSVESAPVERHARRRLDREVGADFNRSLKVVLLRRKVGAKDHPDSEPHLEWSCQWVVSGHWRNQYYPKRERHEPKWILPYVKGPEDKPLKPPSERVFAVVR